MKKKLIIFGNGEIAEIANYYFNNQTNYLVSYFAVDKEFIKDDDMYIKAQKISFNLVLIFNISLA